MFLENNKTYSVLWKLTTIKLTTWSFIPFTTSKAHINNNQSASPASPTSNTTCLLLQTFSVFVPPSLPSVISSQLAPPCFPLSLQSPYAFRQTPTQRFCMKGNQWWKWRRKNQHQLSSRTQTAFRLNIL